MSAITLTFTGKSSQLTTEYFPAIDLDDGEYVCGLVDFQTFNSIPNIDETNNLFFYGYERLETDLNDTSEDEELSDRPNNDIERDQNNNNNDDDQSNNNNINNEIEPSTSQQLNFGAVKRNKRALPFNPLKKKQPLSSILIPTGSYELEDLSKYLKKTLKRRYVELMLEANKNTLQCEILCSQPIDFSKTNSFGTLLGFRHDQILKRNKVHVSELPADILKVNVIRIECSIIQGSYLNNKPSHTIHEFSPRVPPGYKIIEVPQNVIYFPVTVKSIHNIGLSIVDQQNRLINFRGETITVRLHIKKVN